MTVSFDIISQRNLNHRSIDQVSEVSIDIFHLICLVIEEKSASHLSLLVLMLFNVSFHSFIVFLCESEREEKKDKSVSRLHRRIDERNRMSDK